MCKSFLRVPCICDSILRKAPSCGWTENCICTEYKNMTETPLHSFWSVIKESHACAFISTVSRLYKGWHFSSVYFLIYKWDEFVLGVDVKPSTTRQHHLFKPFLSPCVSAVCLYECWGNRYVCVNESSYMQWKENGNPLPAHRTQ